MRGLLIFTLIALGAATGMAQVRSAGLIIGAGGTIVDVAKAVEWDDLEEWDTWAVVVKATGEYELGNGLVLGGEFGTNRLYYWEYRWSDGFYSGFRWNTEWTVNLGVHLMSYLSDQFYLKGGAGLHFFVSGGTVPGLLAAAGYNVSISDQLELPLELRIEPVFGNATPIPVALGTGLRYRF